MSGIVIVIALFLGVGMSLSWVVGHKENVELTDKLDKKTVVERKLTTDLEKTKADVAKNTSKVIELEEKLKIEIAEREKAEKARLLAENNLQLSEEEKRKLAEDAKGEIDELKAMLIATEEGRKRVELERQLKEESDARKQAEEKWLMAETARAAAEKEAAQKVKIEDIQKAEVRLNEELEKLQQELATARQREAELMRTMAANEAAQKARMDNTLKAADGTNEELEKLQQELATAHQREAELIVVSNKLSEQLKESELIRNKAEGVLSNTLPEAKLEKELLEAEKPSQEEVAGTIKFQRFSSEEGWWTEDIIRYKVKKGDVLSRIAAQEFIYNDSRLWIVIYKHNLHKIDNPNRIYPDQILFIPKIKTLDKAEINKIIREYSKEEKQ